MLDYTEDSVMRLHDFTKGEKSEHKGLVAIRAVFDGLFKQLSDLSTLEAPVVDVEENPGMVFLIWKCPGCGVLNATDTFVFDKNHKIAR